MFILVVNKRKKEYKITTPGKHVFYFENLTADLTFVIAAEHAEVAIYGLYQGKDTDDFVLDISQIHTAPHTKSTALIKSVLRDNAQLHMRGKIRVEQNSVGTEALLTNTNLLLSKNAHVISMPQLEILPHEVHCTHAAQTKPLDPDQLDYLINRGITPHDARQLLIDGFLQEILQYKE
ncbi:MAG: SufD family Fe-S cluster assembly protein [Parcubacteria group bacterium]|jgi:Fe-S cluster assembly protein SufD